MLQFKDISDEPQPWTPEEMAESNMILDDLWTCADVAGLPADQITWTYQSQRETIPFDRWKNRVSRVTSTMGLA